MNIDDKDQRIIEVLTQNSKLSTQRIAKKTGIPITTVHNRMKKLEKEGYIKSFTIQLDHKKMGRPMAAYILVTVDYKLLKEGKTTQQDLAKKVKLNPAVEDVNIVAGGTDIVVKVRVKDIDELNQFVTKDLRNIDGIEKTQTLVVLSEV